MEIPGLGRWLIIIGLALLITGVAVALASKLPFLHRLPGDLVFRRNGITIFFPIVTMLVASLVATALINIFFRFFR